MELSPLQLTYLEAIDKNGGTVSWLSLLPDSVEDMRGALSEHTEARSGLERQGLVIFDAEVFRPLLLRMTEKGKDRLRSAKENHA